MGHRSRPRADDQLLLDRHRRATERSRKPVVSVNEDTVIANRAAIEILQQAGQEVVAWASNSSAGAGAPQLLRLANGATAKIRPRPVDVEDPDAGTILEFDFDPDGWGGVRSDGPISVAGTSPQWQGILRLVQASARGNSTVSIEGERGIGKFALARAIHEIASPDGELRVFDIAMVGPSAHASWLADLSDGLHAESGTVVLRHVELLDPEAAHRLSAILDAHADVPVRVIATRIASSDGRPAAVQRRHERLRGFVIQVPPLRERPEDIPFLVAVLSSRLGRSHQRWSVGALNAISRFDWPGNLRQLENVVSSTLLRRPTGDIEPRDLPEEILVGSLSRPLTRMQMVEATEISAALRESSGNKAEAAEALGISRSTLYRKLRSFGVHIERTAT